MFSQTPYAKAFLNKVAFVPYTQEAMNPPQPEAVPPEAVGGAMPPEGGAMPPDAAAAGGAMPPDAAGATGAPPQGGGAPQIQIVQGPNGEPIDAQTGFIVLDQQQGIEQDPLTGILINLSLGQFATPDGQPLDPNQAMQMIEQAREQAQGAGGAMPPDAAGAAGAGAGAPPADGGMPPEAAAAAPEAAGAMPPEAGGAAPQDPAAAAAGAAGVPPTPAPNQSFDPSTGMMTDDATGLPVDPNTGMLVDPTTGQQIDPQSGMPAPQPAQDMPFTDDPEILKVVDQVSKETEKLAKSVSGMTRNINSTHTDLQGIRREISELNDKHDAVLERVDNLMSVAEKLFRGGAPSAPSISNDPTIG